jgi:outer membrane murein-binding lipoprotein Lpp
MGLLRVRDPKAGALPPATSCLESVIPFRHLDRARLHDSFLALRPTFGGRVMKVISAAVISLTLILAAPVRAQTNPSIVAKLDELIAKVDALQASIDALAPSPAKTTTDLLFPFATNQVGFDTAIVIANPRDIAGTCTLEWVGANAPASTTTPTITAAAVYTTLVSAAATNFQGFVRVHCSFPGARGWGVLSDIGLRTVAASIEAEVVP